MKITRITITGVRKGPGIVAWVNLGFDDQLVVHGVTIWEGNDGNYRIVWPSKPKIAHGMPERGADGRIITMDVTHPNDQKFNLAVKEEVVNAYKKYIAEH